MTEREFEIHGRFYAESIDDAFAKLAYHFEDLRREFEGVEPMESRPMEIAVRPAEGSG